MFPDWVQASGKKTCFYLKGEHGRIWAYVNRDHTHKDIWFWRVGGVKPKAGQCLTKEAAMLAVKFFLVIPLPRSK